MLGKPQKGAPLGLLLALGELSVSDEQPVAAFPAGAGKVGDGPNESVPAAGDGQDAAALHVRTVARHHRVDVAARVGEAPLPAHGGCSFGRALWVVRRARIGAESRDREDGRETGRPSLSLCDCFKQKVTECDEKIDSAECQ